MHNFEISLMIVYNTQVPGNIPTSDFERVIDNLMDTHTETSLTLMDTSFTSPEGILYRCLYGTFLYTMIIYIFDV